MPLTKTTLAIVAAGVSLIATAPAQAAFPGDDGDFAFFSSRPIYTVDPGGAHRRVLVESAIGFGGLAISADGLHVAYDASHELYTVNIDGTHTRKITDSATANADNPSFSPDGKQIAFERGYGIWVVGAHGGAQRNLTPDADFNHEYTEPAWSPDGKRIAFTYNDTGAGGNGVWTMNADGSGKTELISHYDQCPEINFRTMDGDQPNWSPDGRRIVFSGPPNCDNSRGRDIWTMNADGSGKANLINDDGTEDTSPVFSPSGTRIAFTRDDDDGYPHIVVMPAGGGAPQRIISDLYAEMGPDWGPAYDTVRVSEKVAKRSVKRGKRLVISGNVSPSQGGKVRVAVKRGHKVVARKSARLSHGHYRWAYKPRKAGRYSVVATLPQGAHHLAAASPARRFKVKR